MFNGKTVAGWGDVLAPARKHEASGWLDKGNIAALDAAQFDTGGANVDLSGHVRQILQQDVPPKVADELIERLLDRAAIETGDNASCAANDVAVERIFQEFADEHSSQQPAPQASDSLGKDHEAADPQARGEETNPAEVADPRNTASRGFVSEPGAARIVANLKEQAGTPWARQAVHRILSRAAMETLVAGRHPIFASMLDSPNAKTRRSRLDQQGAEGARRYLDE